ncbi:MAG: prepilin-type N-terminal cleavage/methylation domain-containing protein [Gemmataceae bacterium]|nr:prepilin-type N-terminal cleavage/methylation domain-containing protein [Gemmataceae bacterium]
MRRTTRPAPRAGFTLIELLVVISIMALLAALVAAGIGAVRSSQLSKATDQTLTKLQKGLDAQWRAVADKARKDGVPGELTAICGGDQDRARALYIYLKLRQAFPQTFAEAQSDVTVSTTDGTYTLPKLRTFAAAALPTTLSDAEQSAALLYMILGNTATSGVAFQADDVTQGAQGQLGTFTVFKDAWGVPIAFARFASNAELQTATYANTKTANKDPIDQLGKLMGWSNPTSKAAAQTAVGAAFDGTNKRVTVVSAGADKDFADDSDNGFGYRLVQQGNRGD